MLCAIWDTLSESVRYALVDVFHFYLFIYQLIYIYLSSLWFSWLYSIHKRTTNLIRRRRILKSTKMGRQTCYFLYWVMLSKRYVNKVSRRTTNETVRITQYSWFMQQFHVALKFLCVLFFVSESFLKWSKSGNHFVMPTNRFGMEGFNNVAQTISIPERKMKKNKLEKCRKKKNEPIFNS